MAPMFQPDRVEPVGPTSPLGGKLSASTAPLLAVMKRPAEALQHPEGDDGGAVVRHRAQGRPDDEDEEPRLVHPDPAEHVAEPPDLGGGDGDHEQVADDHPDDRRQRDVERSLHGRQCEHDDRRVDRGHQHADDHDQEHEAGLGRRTPALGPLAEFDHASYSLASPRPGRPRLIRGRRSTHGRRSSGAPRRSPSVRAARGPAPVEACSAVAMVMPATGSEQGCLRVSAGARRVPGWPAGERIRGARGGLGCRLAKRRRLGRCAGPVGSPGSLTEECSDHSSIGTGAPASADSPHSISAPPRPGGPRRGVPMMKSREPTE